MDTFALSRKRSLDSDGGEDEQDSDDDSVIHRTDTAKLQRTAVTDIQESSSSSTCPTTSHPSPLTCSLPPLCSIKPTSFQSSQALSSHYAKHHAHLCSVKGCGKLFPDERFLDLHIREFHDPIVALQRENGKETYACFAATCDRKFSSPKKRRLHLIDAHKYPKEFFFALPVHGLEQLYARFGESASLVGPVWKPEEQRAGSSQSRRNGKSTSVERSVSPRPVPTEPIKPEQSSENQQQEDTSPALDPLSKSMDKLTLVPNSLRFGRGRGTRFVARPRPRPPAQASALGGNETAGAVIAMTDTAPRQE